ncbi:MAG: hypothetical protein GY768_00505 [Planctomycetaceae bacterium]|nr:hypothetical protein [Planctomycetaceae bacterium]
MRTNALLRRGGTTQLKLEKLEARRLLTNTADLPLLQEDALDYVGAFRVPTGTIGISRFSNAGTGLGFNPDNNSLFIIGHNSESAIAEVAIPSEIISSPEISELNTAEILQPFTDIELKVPNWPIKSLGGLNTLLGDLMVVDGQLIGSVFDYYDGDGDVMVSHFRLNSLDLENSTADGLFQVGDLGGGLTGGYMTDVPLEWQEDFGGPHLTGQATLSILFRTSAGPAAFAFDASAMGNDPSNPVSADPLVYYTVSNPLGPLRDANPVFNRLSKIKDIAFASDSRSVFFFGNHGIGEVCYGHAEECNDSVMTNKGYHAYGGEYENKIWAYDALDLLAVKNGEVEPWEISPYKTWTLDLPFEEPSRRLGGVAYDRANNRLYISQLYADKMGYTKNPIIHVYQFADFNPGNDAPRANRDTDRISENSIENISGNVLSNDSDPENDAITVTHVNDDANVGTSINGLYGSIAITDQGSYTYTLDNDNSTVDALDEGQNLTETFSYTISDSEFSDSANLVITIQGVTDEPTDNPPIASPDSAVIREDLDSTVTGNILDNDSDPDNDSIEITQFGNETVFGVSIDGLYGSIVINPQGNYTYTLNNTNPNVDQLDIGQSLTETFPYTISDSQLDHSTNLVITIKGRRDVSPDTLKADLLTRSGNKLIAQTSTGNSFTTQQVGSWSNSVDWLEILPGDFNGDGHNDITGLTNGVWWVGLSDGTHINNQSWGRWSQAVTWEDVLVADVNNDGMSDIVGRANGNWWVAKSTGTEFVNEKWGSWSNNVKWIDVMAGDINGDNFPDIVGRTEAAGSWWAAESNGTVFTNNRWGAWSPKATWQDVTLGDINGDGRADLIGRTGGDWWVGESTGTSFANKLWASWSTKVDWSNFIIGDFDGNGLTDIAGQTRGNWWVGRSNGTIFESSKWMTSFNSTNWSKVRVADFDGDGKDDLFGLDDENGTVALSTADHHFHDEIWSAWNPELRDIMIGDFI